MVKPEDRELFGLILEAYADLIRSKHSSIYVADAAECLRFLEYFEEFEKCQDLINNFPQLRTYESETIPR
jgi:hypothetical protein